jgi:hypothetical protein
MQLLQSPIPAEAIRDTLASIVREAGYQRTASSTLFSRFWSWLTETISSLFSTAFQSKGAYIVSLALVLGALIIAVTRAVILSRARRIAAEEQRVSGTWQSLVSEATSLAQQAAFADAAHVLYAAVVARIAETKAVRQHSSKTVGDYWRELRRTNHPLASPYREFARTYEIVAYGDGRCDAERYARLWQLAEPLLRPPERTEDTARAA